MEPSTFLMLAAFAIPTGDASSAGPSRLTLMGRASVKIRTAAGAVVYIDPYAKGDYGEPADIILVTHGHRDHNQVQLVGRSAGCVIVAPKGAVSGERVISLAEYDATTIAGVGINAVPSYNANHPRGSGVGYVLDFCGVRLYHAGDTSCIPEMAALRKQCIDYALMPCDGLYNMGPDEAAKAAGMAGARALIPIHSSPDGCETGPNARRIRYDELIVLEAGESMELRGGKLRTGP